MFSCIFRCGSCEYLTCHTLQCDGSRKHGSGHPFSPCVHLQGEAAEMVSVSPSFLSPRCSPAPCRVLWARAQKLLCRCPVLPGPSCPSNLARNFLLTVREKKKINVSGSESSYLRLCCLFISAVTVCHFCVRWDDSTCVQLLLAWV